MNDDTYRPPITYRRGRTRNSPVTSRNPIESYGPELLAALIEGSKNTVVFKFRDTKLKTGRQQAQYLQVRLHTLRSHMRKNNHPEYKIVARCHTSCRWGREVDDEFTRQGFTATLSLYPKDSEFRDAFAAAGITAKDLEGIDPLEGLTSIPDDTPNLVPKGPTPPTYPDEDELPEADPLKKFFP